MAEGIIQKAGGGSASDECTAGKAQVLAGYTAITRDSGDEPANGTMVNHTGVPSKIENRRLNNGRFEVAVAQGYHGCYWAGDSYEYMELAEVASTLGLTAAKLLKGQTVCGVAGMATSDANAAASHILSGKTAYVNGAKISGSITSLAGQTVTPGNTAKTVSCSGKYMTGNITVPAVSNLIAANIKKGVTVGGVAGTFDPLAGDAKDLYYFGKNRAGFSQTAGNCSFGQYSIFSLHTNGVNTFRMGSSGAWNFADYSKLIIEGQNFNARTSSAGGGHGLVTKTGQIAGNYMIPSSITGTKVVYDITGVTWNHKVELAFALDVFASISRIYFE